MWFWLESPWSPAARLVAVGLVGLGSLTNVPVRTEQQVPVFRARTDLVQLDVTVLDASGRPIPGLTAQDFSLTENGRPLVIEAVSEIRIPGADLTARWMREFSSDVSVNLPARDKRLVLIVVDDGRLGPFPPQVVRVREILRDVVDQLGPDDLAAIVFTARNKGAQDWTQDRALLRSAIDSVESWGGGWPPIFAVYSVDVISRLARQLINVPSRRKVLVYVGGEQSVAITNPAGGSRFLSREDSWGIAGRVDAILRDAQRAGISIYPIGPNGLPRVGGLSAQYHRNLARVTGGFATSGTAPDARARIARIFEETGHYYTLGFRAVDDGKTWFHAVQVAVNRPGALVRSQAGYYPPRGILEQASPDPARAESTVAPVTTALAGLLPVSDIRLELALTPVGSHAQAANGDGSHVAVNVRIDTAGASNVAGNKGDLDFELRIFDGEGVKEFVRERLQIPRAASPDRRLAIPLKPGRYSVRVAVYDSETARGGSVYGTTTVPEARADKLSTSGVFVVAPRGTVSMLMASTIASPETSIRRRFGAGEGFEAGVRVSAGSRVRAPVNARIHIVDARDEVVWSETRANLMAKAGSTGWADVLVEVPPDRLAPGHYLLRFILSSGAEEVVRTLVFSIVAKTDSLTIFRSADRDGRLVGSQRTCAATQGC